MAPKPLTLLVSFQFLLSFEFGDLMLFVEIKDVSLFHYYWNQGWLSRKCFPPCFLPFTKTSKNGGGLYVISSNLVMRMCDTIENIAVLDIPLIVIYIVPLLYSLTFFIRNYGDFALREKRMCVLLFFLFFFSLTIWLCLNSKNKVWRRIVFRY